MTEAGGGDVRADSPVVVVANRLPVDQVTDPDGTTRWQRSPGGLVTALEPFVAGRGGAWVGWSGSAGEAPEPFESGGMQLVPVPLSEEEVDGYYEGMSNASLWPLYHDVVEKPEYHRRWWDIYVQVNKRFAARAAEVAGQDAIVWVHDYQLQLVPALLRQLRPDLTIGFFLHIPFPPYELYTQLPGRQAVIEGLLGADLVGFQRPAAAANFVALARRLHELSTRGNLIEYDGRTVAAKAFPISIDVASFDRLAPPRGGDRPGQGDPHRARQPGEDGPGRRPARLHQGDRRPAQRLPGAAGGRRGQRAGDGARAGGHAEPRAGRALRAHAGDDRAAGRAHQRRLRLHRRAGRALLQPVDAPRGARRALPRRRRHAGHPLPRRHEPGGQGVRRRPRRPRRGAGALGVRRRGSRAEAGLPGQPARHRRREVPSGPRPAPGAGRRRQAHA